MCLGTGGPILKPFKSRITRQTTPRQGRPGKEEPLGELGLGWAARGPLGMLWADLMLSDKSSYLMNTC